MRSVAIGIGIIVIVLLLVFYNVYIGSTTSYEKTINDSLSSLYNAAYSRGYDNVTLLLAERVGSLELLPSCGNISGEISYASESYYRVREALNVYRNLAEGLSKDLGVKIPFLSNDEIDELLEKAGEGKALALGSVCGLVEDYNRLVLSARSVEPGKRDTYTPFYYNFTKFIIDIALIKADPSYKIAYKVVGKVFIKTGLASLILKYGGYSALETAMSLAHWEIRYKIRDIIEQYSENPEILLDRLNSLMEGSLP